MTDPITNGENGERDDKGRFATGSSGGPGRKKGISITDMIKKKLQEKFPISDEDTNKAERTYLDELITTILDKALREKDEKMIRNIWNYVDGLPRQKLDFGADKESLGELTEFFRKMAEPKE